MRGTTWLTSAVLFASSTNAFYPYHRRTGSEDRRSNIPAPQPDLEIRYNPTVDIQRRRTKVSEPAVERPAETNLSQFAKRENKYPVVLSSEPTTPDTLGVHQDGSDYSYFCSVKLGSEKKEVWMLIDTGSPSTWVFSSDCKSPACLKHDTFGKEDSKTLNITESTWNVNYGSGKVSGVLAQDAFTLASYDLEIGFGLANQASDDFLAYPMDGILGLGRALGNKMGTPPLLDVMAEKKLLKDNILGIHLSRSADGANDGQITFGAADPKRFKGDLSYTKAVADDGMWEIPCDGAAVDGKDLGLKGKTAILDTGTSYVLLPPADAKILHAQIPGSASVGETFTLPCDAKIPIQITFSGIKYEIQPKDYVGKPDATGKTCASNIIGHQSFGVNTWLLGDVFLKNVYTVFDFDKDRIGTNTMQPNWVKLTRRTGFGTMSGANNPSPVISSSNSSPPSSTEPTAPGSTDGPQDNAAGQTADSTSTVDGSLPTNTGAPLTTTIGKGSAKVEPPGAQTTGDGILDSGKGGQGGAAGGSKPLSGLALWSAALAMFCLISQL